MSTPTIAPEAVLAPWHSSAQAAPRPTSRSARLNETGVALQVLKRKSQAVPLKPGSATWQASEGVRLTVYLPDAASAELVRKMVKAQKGKVIS